MSRLSVTLNGKEYIADLSKGVGDDTHEEYRWVDKFGDVRWQNETDNK